MVEKGVRDAVRDGIVSILTYHANLLIGFLKSIKLLSPVKLSHPNNKFSIEITIYDVMFINNDILAFCKGDIVINNEYYLLNGVPAARVINYICSNYI